MNILPAGVRVWVNERKPKTSAEAAALADDYLQARKSITTEEQLTKTKLQCNYCGKIGHIAKVCRKRLAQTSEDSERAENTSKTQHPERGAKTDSSRKGVQGVKCFNCGGKGHIARACPGNSYIGRSHYATLNLRKLSYSDTISARIHTDSDFDRRRVTKERQSKTSRFD